MSSKNPKEPKRPFRAELPFPWRCGNCGKDEVRMAEVSYDTEVKYDGRLYTITVPKLHLPICQACGAKVFTGQVDGQINAALHSQLSLLTPEEIRMALDRLEMKQKEVAERLGIAEATLSRWLNETQIQSRAMDNLMRVFFAFPGVRRALSQSSSENTLGIRDVVELDESHSTTISQQSK
jgi:putative zinc finger/helix-turn-helix YgiT family protein